MAEKLIELDSVDTALAIFGSCDENIRLLEKEFGVTAVCRGTEIKLAGEAGAVAAAGRAVDAMLTLLENHTPLEEQAVRYCISLAGAGEERRVKELTEDFVAITAKGRPVRAKTLGQQEYLRAIKANSITFGVGPAGTGKTYLAVAMAVKAFKSKEVTRIILTRPAVEAGEKLGFLPGDLKEKLDPYLQPLYDALNDMIPAAKLQKYIDEGTVQIAPLAYMRGRTLDNAFVILDEAQNTTLSQLKMFLTRMGRNAKFIVTGDITQIDLPRRSDSGLVRAMELLQGIDGIGIVEFDRRDIVRHPLVKQIVEAFDRSAAVEAAPAPETGK